MIDRVTLTGLIKLELPGRTVRICDGGTLVFAGETYTSEDSVLGILMSVEGVTEGVGDSAPRGKIIFAPRPEATPAQISSAAMQGSRLRAWIAEVDADTGMIVGIPDQQIDALIDVPRIGLGRNKREVEMDFVSALERLFIVDTGNILSGEYHRRLHPGELGCDNATGVSTEFAWGVASAPRGVG